MTGTILGTIEKPNHAGHGENKKKGEGWLAAAMDRLTPKRCNRNGRRAMNEKLVNMAFNIGLLLIDMAFLSTNSL